MKYKQAQGQLFFEAIVTVAILCFYSSAMAMSWELKNGLALDFDVTVGYAAGIRAEDRDEAFLAADVNKDDGSRNFDQWSLINNRFSVITDIDLNYKGSFGVFARPRAFYDFVYMGSNDNDSAATNNNYIAGAIDNPDEFSDETKDAHGNKAELLDAFVYAGFEVGDGQFVDARIGRQVIQWGESLFISGGIASSMAYLDITTATAPGTEVKEILLPTGAASLQMDLTDSVAIGAFYQWEWEKHRLNESGCYFSDDDFLDETDSAFLFDHPLYGVVPIMSRGQDQHPDEQGQYGFSAMYRAGWLAETEFGLYFVNYHEKLPVFNPDVANGTYYLTYGENIKLYGFSFSTLVGSTNISGELSLRQDFPVVTTNGVEKADYWQAQMSWLYSYAGIPGIDRLGFNGEVGCNKVQEFTDEDLSAQGKDQFAWGFTAMVRPEWYQVLPNLDMSIPIVYKGNPDGTSVNTLTFDEKDDSGSIGINFTYKSAFKGGLKYVHYFNSMENSLSDRDYIAFDFKYTF
jgi:hypothetical protein